MAINTSKSTPIDLFFLAYQEPQSRRGGPTPPRYDNGGIKQTITKARRYGTQWYNPQNGWTTIGKTLKGDGGEIPDAKITERTAMTQKGRLPSLDSRNNGTSETCQTRRTIETIKERGWG